MQVAQLSVEVDQHQETRPRRDRRGSREIEVVILHADVNRYGDAPCLRHSLKGRDERMRRHDDFVALLDASSDQRKPKCIETACDTDTSLGPTIGCPGLLESLYLGAIDECVRINELLELRKQGVLERLVGMPQVEERHTDRRSSLGHRSQSTCSPRRPATAF